MPAIAEGQRWTQTLDFHRFPVDPPLSDAGLEATERSPALLQRLRRAGPASLAIDAALWAPGGGGWLGEGCHGWGRAVSAERVYLSAGATRWGRFCCREASLDTCLHRSERCGAYSSDRAG